MTTNISSPSVLEPELYFLIARFLSKGPCQRAAKVLLEEVEKFKLLPQRVDWEGNEHFRSYEHLCYLNRHIRSDHLLKVVERVGALLDKELKPSVPGVKSLLGAGSLSLLRTAEGTRQTKWSVSQHIVLQHGAPSFPPANLALPSVPLVLGAYQMSGVVRHHSVVPTSTFHKVGMYGRKLGHLSAVYCVLFDRSGRYIFTGADDGLVKIWSIYNMRLLATLRGHSAEITDMAVSFDNCHLASGSCDKVVRVWCLRSKAPAAVLQAHTAMITSVQFCPKPQGNYRYLVSTGNDGCVCFWHWNITTNEFGPKPLKFVERSRAGAQMLCSSFSPGGVFLATGNSDHVVRVYLLHATGIDKICELEAHTDKVDSICYSNHMNRFVSGSNDGTARIWHYERNEWKATVLNMSAKRQSAASVHPLHASYCEPKELRVTMVSWSMDDAMVVTAVSDFSIKVWNAYTGTLLRILEGHEDEVFVLEACPTDARILLSAGHDGKMIIWDIYTGTRIKKFFNLIEGQGHGAVFDCKFSPDGHSIAATDSHGHLLLMGFGTNERCKQIPQQLFFHTDYRPLVRDANNYVLDEQTQQPPHLMPPPYLVDIDGNPYPAHIQRLVPGRENCGEAGLIPQMAVNADGDSEVIGDIVQEGPRAEPNSDTEDEDPATGGGRAAGVASGAARPSLDAMIAQLQREQDNQLQRHQGGQGPSGSGGGGGSAGDHDYVLHSPPPLASPPGNRANMLNRIGMRRNGEVEGVRQSLENVAVRSTKKERDALKMQVTVKPLDLVVLSAAEKRRAAFAEDEMRCFWAERKKKMLSPQDTSTASVLANKKRSQKQKKSGTASLRNQDVDDVPENVETARNRLTTRALYDTEEEEEAGSELDWPSENSSDDYSDWVGDQGSSNLEPPKRRSQRKRKRRRLSSSEEDEDAMELDEEEVDVEEEEEVDTDASTTDDSSDEDKTKDQSQASPVKRERSQRIAQRRPPKKAMRKESQKKKKSESRPPLQPVDPNTNSGVSPRHATTITELDERFRPPDWITTVIPRKAPFVPQMGDEALYFRQGHELYLNAVIRKKVYAVDLTKNQPWHKLPNLRAQELVKIVGIKWLMLPPRLCCLKLAFIDTVTGKMTGKSFTIKYHDMPDVIDFIVLKHHYDISIERKWKPGCRFRSMIDDQWWLGTIKTHEPLEPDFPDSLYQCFNVHWDNGEFEKLSPWDMEPVDPKRKPARVGEGVDVTQEEYKSLLYVPKKTEWPACGREEDTTRLVHGIGALMQHSVAEHFIAPVDLQQFPTYAYHVHYPIDLSTIKTRLENGFYRRVTALQWDVRLIYSNASCFNQSGSRIVTNANALTETLLRFIKDVNCQDPLPIMASLTHQDLRSGSSDEDSQPGPSGVGRDHKDYSPSPSSSPKKKGGKSGRDRSSTFSSKPPSSGQEGRAGGARQTDPNAWLEQSESLLAMLFECEDSEPFRVPVDPTIYTDYEDIVSSPMDLTTVHTKLATGHYSSPMDMCRDIRLIFQNSKLYNTNKRSRIYSMTLRLSALFEAQIKDVLSDWKTVHRSSRRIVKESRSKRKASPPPTPSLGWDILTNTLLDPNRPGPSGLGSQTVTPGRAGSLTTSGTVPPYTSLSVITGSTSASSSSGPLSASGLSSTENVHSTVMSSSLLSAATTSSGAAASSTPASSSTAKGKPSSSKGQSSVKENGNIGEDSDATIVDGSDDDSDGGDTEVCDKEATFNGHRRNLKVLRHAGDDDDDDDLDYGVDDDEDDDDYKPSSKYRQSSSTNKGKSLIRGNQMSKGKKSHPSKSASSRLKSSFTSDGNSNESNSSNEEEEHDPAHQRGHSSRLANSRVLPEADTDDEQDGDSPKRNRRPTKGEGKRDGSSRSVEKHSGKGTHASHAAPGEGDAPVHRKAQVGRSGRGQQSREGKVGSAPPRAAKHVSIASARPSRSSHKRKLYIDPDSDDTDTEARGENKDRGRMKEEEEEDASTEEDSSEKSSEDSEDELLTETKKRAKAKASSGKKTKKCPPPKRKKQDISSDDDEEEEDDDDDDDEEDEEDGEEEQEDSESDHAPPKKKSRLRRPSPPRKPGKKVSVSGGSGDARPKSGSRSKPAKNTNSGRETRNRGQQKVTYLDEYYSEEYEEEEGEDTDNTSDTDSDTDGDDDDGDVAESSSGRRRVSTGLKARSVSSRGRVRKLTARARDSLKVH